MSEQVLTVVAPGPAPSERLVLTLEEALRGHSVERIVQPKGPLQDRRVLFAVPVDETGGTPDVYQLLARLRAHPDFLRRSVGGILIDGAGDLYTKSLGRELALAANRAGCAFPGRGLVEATGALRNFTVQAKNGGCSLEEAYRRSVRDLADRVLCFEPPRADRPKLLVLHASSYRTSNTLALWSRVRERLESSCDITEIGLRNGTLEDCSGCPYTMCLHFGEVGSCFYGGVIVREVYPALREADAVVMLCPNYNDAVPANLSAAINRLTALYRTTPFDRKALFAIVVSGYSGGDIVAQQLAGALNMNKGFWLPPDFCLLETANDAGSAQKLPGIEARLEQFAANMLCQLKREANASL